MTALQISFLLTTIVLLSSIILLSVLFLKALSKSQLHAERVHERANENLQTTLDRLMAMDFHSFKSYQMAANAPEGGYDEPAPEAWGEVVMLTGLEGGDNAAR